MFIISGFPTYIVIPGKIWSMENTIEFEHMYVKMNGKKMKVYVDVKVEREGCVERFFYLPLERVRMIKH